MHEARHFVVVLRARKVSGAFEKRAAQVTWRVFKKNDLFRKTQNLVRK